MAPAPVQAASFDVVYNLSEGPEGLYLPTAYIVSRDREGLLSHIQQKAVSETIQHFKIELDEVRKTTFKLIEEVQVKALESRFSPPKKKEKPLEELMQDADIQKAIFEFVHRRVDRLLNLVVRYGLPLSFNVDRRVLVKDFLVETSREVLQPELMFRRTPQGVTYRLRLRRGDLIWRLSSREVVPLTNNPAWVLMDGTLYFVKHINGNMVKPFRERDELHIPNASVKTYFQKFIIRVASQIDIEADGFEIRNYDTLLSCRLQLNTSFFVSQQTLVVYMEYPHAEFDWKNPRLERTSLEINGEEIGINKVTRQKEKEQAYIRKLVDMGLSEMENGQFFLAEAEGADSFNLLSWLIDKKTELEQAGFVIAPVQIDDKEVYLMQGSLQLQTSTAIDWFDVFGEVVVGTYTISFLSLAKYIQADNRFYPLPNGAFFIIPQEWMEKYKSLVQFGRKEGDNLRLNKNQFTLLQGIGLQEENNSPISIPAEAFVVSAMLKANLRPYQLEGARWLVQLYQNGLGACLADDMGLGKTVQTLAALLHAKEKKAQEAAAAERPVARTQLDLFTPPAPDEAFLQPLQALIVLPASLVFNWETEIRKFAPNLNVYLHVGPKRHQDIRLLRRFDIILTTYQTALRDVELLKTLEYEYIVLDESQQIKNRESKVFKAINQLPGRHKISLSGTPIENSLSDLWAQMQFINPDLLGSYAFFQKEFITPIEKRRDDEKKRRLRNLVAPYLLRRTKEEVAKDLPPLTTQIFYSEMGAEQKKLYEKEKSAARNYLLENFDASSPQYRIMVLQSLTKLRQICNHPRMVYPDFQQESGKFNDVLEQWSVIKRSNHKALFFSSFVQYLDLFKLEFETTGQPYSILTGSMTANDRVQNIQQFETSPDVQSFLISIKSGGVGLNLTAADYVFILDPWWNPTIEQQAIARAHRIGQSNNVFAVKFITKDSIEEKILQLQSRKSKLAEDILENVREADFTRGDLEYLLE